jgi:hypothetical protein
MRFRRFRYDLKTETNSVRSGTMAIKNGKTKRMEAYERSQCLTAMLLHFVVDPLNCLSTAKYVHWFFGEFFGEFSHVYYCRPL